MAAPLCPPAGTHKYCLRLVKPNVLAGPESAAGDLSLGVGVSDKYIVDLYRCPILYTWRCLER